MFFDDMVAEQIKFNNVQQFLDSETNRLNMLIKEYKEDIKAQGSDFNMDNPNGGMYSKMELTEIHYDMEKKMIYSEEAANDIYFYKKLRLAPYFARVDFKADGALKEKTVYIGLRTLQDPDTFEMYVCDWRAPIASLFYEDFEEKAWFEAPRGKMYGDLLLKRQYKFEDGQLKYYIDNDVKIDDDILRDVLSTSSGEHLKVIVNSIQREQNKVVRYAKDGNMLVLGPAGSGKTSVGFHRLAYLLYQNRTELSSAEIIMFSNNDIFSSYVADIIPELGEMPINYASFYSIFAAELPTLNVGDYYALADDVISGNKSRLESATVKMGADFINHLECGAIAVEPEFSDILLFGDVVVSAKELIDRYHYDDENTPKARGERLAAYAQNLIDEYFTENKISIYEKIDEDTSIDEDTAKLVKAKRRELKQSCVEMIRRSVLVDPWVIYYKLLMDYAEEKSMPHLLDTVKRLKDGIVEFEDALGIVYVKSVLGTSAVISGVKHILVDEAQDLSLIQHRFLQKMFPRARVTLLADTNQAIIPGLNTVDENLLADIYGAETLRLNKSYRSTVEINEFAVDLLPENKKYEVFDRSGEKVEITAGDMDTLKELVRSTQESRKTLCIIAKTADESRDLYKKLKKDIPSLRLCDNKSCELSGAPVVMPLALTKGLEFDSVIVADINKGFTEKGNESYLYLASTRALHKLTVFTIE